MKYISILFRLVLIVIIITLTASVIVGFRAKTDEVKDSIDTIIDSVQDGFDTVVDTVKDTINGSNTDDTNKDTNEDIIGGGTSAGDTSSDSNDNDTVVLTRAQVQYSVRGDISNLAYNFDDSKTPNFSFVEEGDTVEFCVTLLDDDYIITSVELQYPYNDTVISQNNGVYSFVVPEFVNGSGGYNVYIKVELKPIVDDTVYYTLDWELLGNGNMDMFNIDAPTKVAEGDSVTLSVSIKDEYVGIYEYSLKIESADGTIEELLSNDCSGSGTATVTFNMPASTVSVTIYCIKI